MSFSIVLSDRFKKEAKPLIKKYASLRKELQELGISLAAHPTQGTPLGNNVYKIRLSIASKGKGKSGGARVISYIILNDKTVLLLSIYNKGERECISDKEIQALIKKYVM